MIDKKKDDGFTIIELMIATLVLATLILMATTIMVSIGNLFNKSANQSQLQDSLRNIMQDVTTDLKLSSGYTPNSSGGVNVYCIGTVRYSYVTGQEIGSTYKHILWRDSTSDTTSGCVPADLTQATPSNDGSGLVGSNTEIASFSVTGSSSPYTITINMAYGNPSDFVTSGGNVSCRGLDSESYCSTASLTTVIDQRLF